MMMKILNMILLITFWVYTDKHDWQIVIFSWRLWATDIKEGENVGKGLYTRPFHTVIDCVSSYYGCLQSKRL